MINNFEITAIFPCPIYRTERDSDTDLTEKEEIKRALEITTKVGDLDHYSNDTYIFNTILKNLKEFCEQHVKNYVKEILNPEEELDFYITQSWLNVVEPGGTIPRHWHSNSIVSGVFYISTENNDRTTFIDPNIKEKELMYFYPKKHGVWNSANLHFYCKNNELILFPSWLEHKVIPNVEATSDRISISFNTFAKGLFGKRNSLNELIL
jgi:uncharacterized protein (TIGR02466 family)